MFPIAPTLRPAAPPVSGSGRAGGSFYATTRSAAASQNCLPITPAVGFLYRRWPSDNRVAHCIWSKREHCHSSGRRSHAVVILSCSVFPRRRAARPSLADAWQGNERGGVAAAGQSRDYTALGPHTATTSPSRPRAPLRIPDNQHT
ncbi:hypothetical protein E2C01_082032 [Portunus trituberculatus]|uniref:Uncharacterized protein n=1 Tax=Portunus trituberculatus TaxID=210409 RepID=A0A5B7IY10_PORTR|nr:hypothetical protein [Portunus trituberculatus]